MLKLASFPLALIVALPAWAQAPTACSRFCPSPTAQVLQELDTKSADTFVAQGTALIRVFLEDLAGRPVFEIALPRGGKPELTIRMMQDVDGAQVLISRSIELPDTTWRDLLAQARGVKDKHERAQSEADAARRAALANGKSGRPVEELVCLHGSSAYFELASEGILFGTSADTCSGAPFAIGFANVIAREALKRMSACDVLLPELDRGLSYTLRRCMILNGVRKSAAEVSNIVHAPEFSTDTRDVAPDLRALQRYFVDKCHMKWEGQFEVIGGFQCANAWAHFRTDPSFGQSLYLPAPYENFYGTDAADTVVVTGRIEKYIFRPVNEPRPEDSADVLSARSSMTWRRAEDGTWKIETWFVGPLIAVHLGQ
jgi:hypothetical protein